MHARETTKIKKTTKTITRLTAKTTKTIKKKNNPSKFPAGYAYILDNQEAARMRSKILTSSKEVADNEGISNLNILLKELKS